MINSIDFDMLGNLLKEVETNKKTKKPLDPLRGLSGELKRKQSVVLAGSMHSCNAMTNEEEQEIKRIQAEHDRLNRTD